PSSHDVEHTAHVPGASRERDVADLRECAGGVELGDDAGRVPAVDGGIEAVELSAEVQVPIHLREVRRVRCAAAGVQLGDEHGAVGRAVGAPKLAAVDVVRGGEVQLVVD